MVYESSKGKLNPDDTDYRTRFQPFVNIAPLACLILDSLLNRLRLPVQGLGALIGVTALFFLTCILTEAFTNVPADMEHLNFFCKGTMSHLYDAKHNIYMATSYMKTCEGLEDQKNVGKNPLVSDFDNSTLSCRLFSTKVFCKMSTGPDEHNPTSTYLASKKLNNI